MLFDLQSPGRRRVIKVIYAMLAVLMGGGLIFFGIGSDASGGLSEIFGGGGGTDKPFEDDIEDAEKRAEANPQDAAAQCELVQLHYQAGTQQIEVDPETGSQDLTTDAEESLTKSADAWDRCQKLSGAKVDPSAALLAVQTYSTLANAKLRQAASGSGQEALDDADDSLTAWNSAAGAQQVIADDRGDAEAYATLAQFLYFGGEFDAADQATQQALSLATGKERTQIENEAEQVEQQARGLIDEIETFRKQLAQAGAGAPAGGDNPLSDLGGGGGSGGGLGGDAGGGLATP